MRWDPSNAEVLVYTYRQGLLSSFGHDLEIKVTSFTIDGDEQARRGEARFDARSLRVHGPVYDGVVKPDSLSDSDKRSIETSIVSDVLEAAKYPDIRFVGLKVDEHGDEVTVTGELTLHGTTHPLAVVAHRRDGRWVADVPLHQPDFGIQPYSALMGAIRVKPDVRVRISAVDPR